MFSCSTFVHILAVVLVATPPYLSAALFQCLLVPYLYQTLHATYQQISVFFLMALALNCFWQMVFRFLPDEELNEFRYRLVKFGISGLCWIGASLGIFMLPRLDNLGDGKVMSLMTLILASVFYGTIQATTSIYSILLPYLLPHEEYNPIFFFAPRLFGAGLGVILLFSFGDPLNNILRIICIAGGMILVSIIVIAYIRYTREVGYPFSTVDPSKFSNASNTISFLKVPLKLTWLFEITFGMSVGSFIYFMTHQLATHNQPIREPVVAGAFYDMSGAIKMFASYLAIRALLVPILFFIWEMVSKCTKDSSIGMITSIAVGLAVSVATAAFLLMSYIDDYGWIKKSSFLLGFYGIIETIHVISVRDAIKGANRDAIKGANRDAIKGAKSTLWNFWQRIRPELHISQFLITYAEMFGAGLFFSLHKALSDQCTLKFTTVLVISSYLFMLFLVFRPYRRGQQTPQKN